MTAAPPTDARRAQALRAALAEMAPWLAPEWAGLDQKGDFGAALYEIAARLAEHSTRRLDQTALRDKLAFLATLDIATPAPRSATVPIVFTLAEKRREPVYAPARVQVAAAGDGDPIIFETREAIAITPARALRLIAADPGADRIELAPPEVTAAPRPAPPPVTYRLVSAAEPGGTMLQLAQAVGLAAGDLLRIAGTAYRIEKRSGEIVTLLDRLVAPAGAGTAVEKVVRLDSFALRNLSEHLAYVGHKELLKLDGAATIALRLDPPGLVRRLTQLDLSYEIWGKPKGADAADWQPLRLLGGRAEELRLSKDWEGAVEEVEAAGRKSRWIRLRLLTPIADAAPPDTRLASVALKVNSTVDAATEPTEGSRSIVSAFYNGLPLPLTTAFLPFGPEPQRFDTFAVAAPEALSKTGAAVHLDITLSDASLGSLAATAGATPHRLYGVGRNGRLQAIRFDSGTVRWRQLDRPPPPTSGSGAPPRLDPGRPCYPLQTQAGEPATDLVVMRDTTRALWMAAVRSDAQNASVSKWTSLPRPAEPPDDYCLIYTRTEAPPGTFVPVPGPFGTVPWFATPAAPPLPPVAHLVVADATGLHMQALDTVGATPQPWKTLTPTAESEPAPPAPLLLAPVVGGFGLIVAIDRLGEVHRGAIVGETIEWSKLALAEPADAAVQPAALLHDDRIHLVLATKTRAVVMLREGAESLSPPADEMRAAGEPVSIAAWPADPSGPDFPLVAVVGRLETMLWSDRRRADAGPVPSEGDPGKVCSVIATPSSGSGAKLILGSPNERLLHAPVESGKSTLPFEAFDLLRPDPGTSPDFYLLDPQAVAGAIDRAPFLVGGVAVIPIPRGELKTGQRYWLLSALTGAARTGKPVGEQPKQLRLDPSDGETEAGDILKIGEPFFEVDKVRDTETGRIATLAADLPKGALDYTTYRRGARRQFVARDQETLLRFATPLPSDVTELEFAAPADPARQTCSQAAPQSSGEGWARVAAAWTTAPIDGQASFTVPRTLGAWTKVALPRSSENPELSWEYFDGRGWRRLDRDFSDGTANFASSGSLRFTVPDDLSPTDVAGKQDYWIRARLIGGDYGRPSYVVETSGNRQSINIDRSSLNPPEIFSIEARYALQSYADPQMVLTVNNLAIVDQTQAAAAAGAGFALFEDLAAHTGDPPGLGRAIYLGLSRPPAVDALSLYVDAVDVDAAPLRLRAEVLRPEGWVGAVCDDETAGLTRPGLLRLFPAAPPAQLPLFGCDGWWLRLRPIEPTADWAPVLRGLHLNAVTAEQAKSIRQEILGSSLGAPDQSYTLAEPPVLSQTLELRVRESLSDEEKAALEASDPAAVATYPDIDGEWIRWRAIDSFAGEDGGARVFRVDPATGEIRFGNGRDGKIPPAGRDAIRAVAYQSGGGSRGNLPVFAVSQLKTALQSVELAVNPVDAGGGAEPPPEARLAETAPSRLRHATRALTPPDVEALATGSAPDVVRARCLRGRGCAIDLVVAIRQTGERCPVPSRARREGIARQIADAGWGALTPEAIRVRPPRYVHISVEAVVIARTAEAVAQVENDVRAALVHFLHPIDGGSDGLGWPFARRPWPSDVQRVAAAVAGVDRVVDVAIAPRDAGVDLDRLGPDALICAEEQAIRLSVEPPRSAR